MPLSRKIILLDCEPCFREFFYLTTIEKAHGMFPLHFVRRELYATK